MNEEYVANSLLLDHLMNEEYVATSLLLDHLMNKELPLACF
jgi:hypothetical protein